MCLVLGRIFGTCTISRAAELSSNTWQYTVALWLTRTIRLFTSSSKYIRALACLVADNDNAINSDSAEVRANWVCNFDDQYRGTPAYLMMKKPDDRDFAVLGLSHQHYFFAWRGCYSIPWPQAILQMYEQMTIVFVLFLRLIPVATAVACIMHEMRHAEAWCFGGQICTDKDAGKTQFDLSDDGQNFIHRLAFYLWLY